MSDRLALIIANSRFDDERLSRLVAPNEDALALQRVLEDKAIGGFSVRVLVDEPFQHIREAIVDLYERRKRGDLLLLYYSGHGITDDYGELYLAAKDTRVESVSAAGIDATFVRKCLDRSNSQRKVIILDCCHSGAFAAGTKAAIGSSVGTETAFAGSGYGWGILTASNAFEFAWEDASQPVAARRSIFTHILVRGLESGEADLDWDDSISLQDLYGYAREELLKSGHTAQTPMMWTSQTEGQIAIAWVPHPRSRPATTLAPELLADIADARAWRRRGAISELARLLRGPDEACARVARQMLEKMTHDDSRTVSNAAGTALREGAPSVAKVSQPRHPGLKVSLAPETGSAAANTEVRWTVTLDNTGDDDLRQVHLLFGSAQKGEPFDLLAGRQKRFTLGRTYATAGDKTEQVTAEGTAGDGSTVRHEAQATVTIHAPAHELHPSVKITLSASPVVADAGQQVTWTMSVRNDGDDDLQQVALYFSGTSIGNTFPLPVGKRRRFTLDRTYTTSGDKSEYVTAEGTSSSGKTVRSTTQTKVTVRQPAKQAPSASHDTLREAIKALAREAYPDAAIQCPICDVHVSGKNLVRHYDKVHAGDTTIDVGRVRRAIAVRTSVAGTQSTEKESKRTFNEVFQQSRGQTPPANRTTAKKDAGWASLKARADQTDPESTIECPICNATLKAKNARWHYDRRHAGKKSEPAAKTAGDTGKRIERIVGTHQEVNIVLPIALKLLRVPAGEFIMGSDPTKDRHANANEQPQHRVALPEYLISEYPITNAQYEVFVKATGHDVPESWKRLLLKPKIPSGMETFAVTGISWYDAVAFCHWLSTSTGKTFRLPTEAEWEKAARGTDGRILATMNPATNWLISPASMRSANIRSLQSRLGGGEIEATSPYGCANMMGHGWEWTHSLFWKYPYRANDGREDESSTQTRAVRGSGLRLYVSYDHPLRYAERGGNETGAGCQFRVVLRP